MAKHSEQDRPRPGLPVLHEWSDNGLEWRIVETYVGPQGMVRVGDQWVGFWTIGPDFPLPGLAACLREVVHEIARLASPEAAWETVEAFNRGAEALTWTAFLIVLEPYHQPNLDYIEAKWPEFRRHPWGFCATRQPQEPGRALFAECLRLGREGR